MFSAYFSLEYQYLFEQDIPFRQASCRMATEAIQPQTLSLDRFRSQKEGCCTKRFLTLCATAPSFSSHWWRERSTIATIDSMTFTISSFGSGPAIPMNVRFLWK
jgi:hypothetical protein